jgi:hypothetical protein
MRLIWSVSSIRGRRLSRHWRSSTRSAFNNNLQIICLCLTLAFNAETSYARISKRGAIMSTCCSCRMTQTPMATTSGFTSLYATPKRTWNTRSKSPIMYSPSHLEKILLILQAWHETTRLFTQKSKVGQRWQRLVPGRPEYQILQIKLQRRWHHPILHPTILTPVLKRQRLHHYIALCSLQLLQTH